MRIIDRLPSEVRPHARHTYPPGIEQRGVHGYTGGFQLRARMREKYIRTGEPP
jgi:hypothetical protein